MPPRGRRGAASAPDKSDTLALGFVGTGELDEREVEAMLTNLFSTEGISKVECIFALTNDALGPAEKPGLYTAYQQAVVMSTQTDPGVLTVAAVTFPDGDADDKALHEEATDDKVRLVAIGDQAAVTVVDELVAAKSAGADARLVVFWVTEEDDTADSGAQYAALESAGQAGIPGFNACNALDDMNLGAPESEQPVAAEPAEPARRGRGRPRSAPAEDSAPTAAQAASEAAEPETPPTRRRRGSAAASADEAQTQVSAESNGQADLSDAGVGDILDAFAGIIAKKVAAILQS